MLNIFMYNQPKVLHLFGYLRLVHSFQTLHIKVRQRSRKYQLCFLVHRNLECEMPHVILRSYYLFKSLFKICNIYTYNHHTVME